MPLTACGSPGSFPRLAEHHTATLVHGGGWEVKTAPGLGSAGLLVGLERGCLRKACEGRGDVWFCFFASKLLSGDV